ncbi:MAG: hypothetical protein LBN43_04230 [Oscillospiraceae bacterium]|jgi:hypothetical protein|nr:hypothetical protein [Oscillospiraceae bacterium]
MNEYYLDLHIREKATKDSEPTEVCLRNSIFNALQGLRGAMTAYQERYGKQQVTDYDIITVAKCVAEKVEDTFVNPFPPKPKKVRKSK